MWPDESAWTWWGVTATLASVWLLTEVILYLRKRRRRLGPEILTASLKPLAPWHEELERCHEEFVKYVGTPYEYPIGQREIAATQAFLPHIVRLCRVLDDHGIPHPPIDTGDLTFTGTGEWGTFLASLLALRSDVEAARSLYRDMKAEDDD